MDVYVSVYACHVCACRIQSASARAGPGERVYLEVHEGGDREGEVQRRARRRLPQRGVGHRAGHAAAAHAHARAERLRVWGARRAQGRKLVVRLPRPPRRLARHRAGAHEGGRSVRKRGRLGGHGRGGGGAGVLLLVVVVVVPRPPHAVGADGRGSQHGGGCRGRPAAHHHHRERRAASIPGPAEAERVRAGTGLRGHRGARGRGHAVSVPRADTTLAAPTTPLETGARRRGGSHRRRAVGNALLARSF